MKQQNKSMNPNKNPRAKKKEKEKVLSTYFVWNSQQKVWYVHWNRIYIAKSIDISIDIPIDMNPYIFRS